MKTSHQVKKIYCGIDVSGDTLDVCYQSTNGNVQWCRCENTATGFKRYGTLPARLTTS